MPVSSPSPNLRWREDGESGRSRRFPSGPILGAAVKIQCRPVPSMLFIERKAQVIYPGPVSVSFSASAGLRPPG